MSSSSSHKTSSISCFSEEFEFSAASASTISFDDEWTDEHTRMYESIFLHDLLNSVGGLRGYLELAGETENLSSIKKYASNSLFLCDSLIDEIEYHRQFLLAKNGNFKPISADTTTTEILKLTVLTLDKHAVSKDRKIEISIDCSEKIQTDKVLLSRLLVNMTKNAIEATEDSGIVCVGAGKLGGKIRFAVHNSSFIPEETKKQLFKSQFSTKGNNRGIGLFSIKLLCEKLGGTLGFASSEENGTYFFIDLPLRSQD